MVKFTMSLPEAMKKALEEEMKKRRLDSIQETIRSVLAEYFSKV
jgi:metal-responsive CopG/Arc/MetJ family transcriptional regulator